MHRKKTFYISNCIIIITDQIQSLPRRMITVVTAQNKMTAAVPGTLPEVKLSEFLAMTDGVFQRRADGT